MQVCHTEMELKMKKIKCALIGYGYWGKIVEKYIVSSEYFELARICGREGELKQLSKDKELEAVFICTPINTHYEIARLFLSEGIHVFCEKPLTKNLDETRELISLAKEKQVCLYTDYIYTVSESINYIKKRLPEVGAIKMVEGTIEQFGSFYPDDDVYEVIGVHMLSVMADFFGEAVEGVQITRECVLRRDEKGNALEARLEACLRNDMRMSFALSLVSDKKCRRLKIIGENGILNFNMLGENTASKVLVKKEYVGYSIAGRENKKYDEGNNIRLVLKDFGERIRSRRPGNIELAERVALLLKEIKDYSHFV